MSEHKKIYSQIEIGLVLPYLNSSIDDTGYCYTIFPPLETVPKRFAIIKRNEWMVEQADIVVAYTTHEWGGAAKTLAHARRKNKQIILYSPN